MATYKDIVGTAVRNNAGNLTTADTGQVWFDSTNLDFKYLFPAVVSSWSTGGSLNTARGVSRFCAPPPVLINSIPSMIIQAKGMPRNVEAMFAKAIPENAWRGESDSNRRERTPSKRTIGANATIIAGNCNVIIGTPAFAIRIAVINLLHQWWVWPSPPTPGIKS